MIDYTKGFDDEMITEKAPEERAEDNLVSMPKPKHLPFAVWKVGEREYKLKLTAADIVKLEQMYRRNLLLYLTEDGIPAVADMLTTIQAAMRSYNHGMTYQKVQDVYNQYVDEGGNQMTLLTDVLMPLLAVSGFFTQSQAEDLAQEMTDISTRS